MTAEKFDLQQLRVASPCYERWDKMKGDERVRHCASCKLNVYNLSEMTKADAEELVGRTEGRLCVRFLRRWDGTVMTADCPVGVSRARVRLASALVTAAAFVGVLLLPLVRGLQRVPEEEPVTFQERLDMLKDEAYDWPVFGVLLEEISPRPRRYTMGAMISIPRVHIKKP
ncbi:MAG TPA: hypothetical protein VK539_02165 [Myxococcaceae bacterium]|nr:hypothetical protein [Myxococcaceae bacterium]